MSKIPNVSLAEVDLRKLTDYILSPEHPLGRHKARVFESTLGITVSDADTLRDLLLKAVQENDATITDEDKFGVRYQVDFDMSTDVGNATIRSGWIIRSDDDYPRFVTCYVI